MYKMKIDPEMFTRGHPRIEWD